MLILNTESELSALHTGVVKENLRLEYKASDAIDKNDNKKKLEMARDVSAFSNADGGQIVYGMKENKDHEPDGLDAGLDPREYPEIWFEQVLQQHVTPLLTAVKPRHVPLSTGRVAVVMDIPASTGDPHQVDGRYYRRHNFNRLIMEHYEVRDAFRRLTTPDLFVSLSFLEGNRHMLAFPSGDDSSPFNLIARIENKSPQPAFHVVIDIGIDTDFKIASAGGFQRFQSSEMVEQTPLNWLRWSMASPPGLPIFKEHQRLVTDNVIMLSLPHAALANQEIHDLTVRVVAPGCVRQENWSILAVGPRLTIHGPDSAHTAKR
jgi:Putative DNA-binding domain